MDLRPLPPSPSPGLVNLLVEIPAGSRNKYEFSPEAGLMVLDRVFHAAIRYPFDYGFVPNTKAEDGSPLDAMAIMSEPTFAGCLIRARPIGLLELEEDGCPDPKLLCVPDADPRQSAIRSIRQIASSQLEEVSEFFRTYRSFEGRVISIGGWRDVDAVPSLLNACIRAGR
ncbi:inorganic diphosphatase [Synechococcus sp. CC9616]|uniref:inorganic diphosphatase n=1 Tax=Synechococcus sp. CC9616 TaxID=110663 RepID=UPI00048F4EC3|nr:inorganic diphosphatase [Synechococcus sp. CC9616]